MTLAVPEHVMIALRAITKAANAGAKCPSNRDLALVMGVSSIATAARAVALLEVANVIRVERSSTNRVVTIVASGKATAGRVLAPHWRLTKPAKPRRPTPIRDAPVEPERVFLQVSRDPYPRCGVRGDVPCGHSRSALVLGAHV